jgi:uncharacterized protein (TIGR03437 family)
MKSFRALFVLAGAAAVCASGQTTTPAFTTGQAARLIIGQRNFTYADYGATNQLIGSPAGIAYANGILWVADSNRLGSTPDNNRVLRFSDLSTYPSPTDRPDLVGSTCGVCRGSASLVLGQPDFTTTNIPVSPTARTVRNPSAVATDGTVLAVADTDNNRVLIWLSLPTTNDQPADVVIGQADFTHSATAVPPTQTSLRGPEGVWIDHGRLFIADTQDNRVLIYNKIPTTNKAPADVVVGQTSFTAFVQPDLTASQPSTAANNMQSPVSVSTDGTRLFVSDLGQNRVLIFKSIPTTNGAAADVALGQPDLVSATPNNAYTITNSTLDANNNPEGVTPVLCQTNGTDASNYATYPTRCAATLSFPRFVISDGKRLFVADGGNDRVMVYNTIPTTNGARADIILGQPDEFSDDTGLNPDGADAFQTPTSLAWDGTNLYVSDGYNRRVVVYSQGVANIPLSGIRNSASLEIYALGSVTVAGSITAKDTLTITINGTAYTYTVVAADTLTTIVQNLVKIINKAPDPNVIATANLSNLEVTLTARTPGANGGNITVAASVSTNATEALTASGSTLNIYLENPSQIAPGTVIVVNGTNLCDNTSSASFSQPYLATSLNGCTLYVDGVAAPLLYASPTQLTAQMMEESQDRTSVSIYVRSQHADGSVTVTTPVATTIVPQNPGIYALSGNDPRRGIVYHGTSSAFDLIDVDGTIQAGDVGSITIGSATYSYTVQTNDTLANVRDGLIAAINSAPDPYVYAYATNEFTRIGLSAVTPGPQGEGTTVTVTQTTATTNTSGALLLLTAYNATMCCSNIEGALVTTDNPAVPGEMLYVLATGLGVTTPQTVDTGQVYQGGSALNPLVAPVDSILTGGTTANPVSVGLVPGTVGVYYVQFLLNSGLASNQSTQMTIAQQSFVSNVVTFPVSVPGLATTLVVTPSASSVAVGNTLNYTVTALDYTGAPATSYTGTVVITSSDSAATLPANFALSSGTGSFAITFGTTGLQTVTATDNTTQSINGTSVGVTVTKAGSARTPGPVNMAVPKRPLPIRR